MVQAGAGEGAPITGGTLIRRSLRLMWWVWIFPVALIVALVSGNFLALVYVHAISGVLWTGADLFLAFILGPVMRSLDPPQRKRVMASVVSRTLVYMFLMSATTTTAGYYVARAMGALDPTSSLHGVALAAGIIGIALFIQGVGGILPTDFRLYLETAKESPDPDLIRHLLRRFLGLVTSQAMLQLAVIFVMTLFIA